MLSTRKKDDDKPWNGIIKTIARALNLLDEKFRLAFPEGFKTPSSETEPNEKLKLIIYEDFLKEIYKFFTRPDEFETLEAVEAYYQHLQSDEYFKKYLDAFKKRKSTLIITKRHNLAEVISERKLVMLKKMISLYQVVARVAFLAIQLNRYLSVQDCSDRVHFLFEEYQANAELISDTAILSHRQVFVDPLKVLNAQLIQLMQEKNYGTIDMPSLCTLQREAADADVIYLWGDKLLQSLPSVADIYAVAQKKAADAKYDDGHTLEDYAAGLQSASEFLQSQTMAIVAVSCQQQNELVSKLAALKEIEKNELKQNKLDDFFRLSFQLKKTLPMLQKALTELEEHCDIQVNKLWNLNPLNKTPNVWTQAKSVALDRVTFIVELSESALRKYKPCLERYNEVNEGHRKLPAQYKPAQQLVVEWRAVNQQSEHIVANTKLLLEKIQRAVQVLSAVPAKEFPAYMKRHWPEYTVSLIAGAGGSAALTAWLFSLTVMAPMVSIPVLGLSVLTAAGVAKYRDIVSPPPPSAVDEACQSLHENMKVNAPSGQVLVVPEAKQDEKSSGWTSWIPGVRFFATQPAAVEKKPAVAIQMMEL